MKAIFLFPAILFCVLTCHAQVEMEVFAGPLVSSATYHIKGNEQPTDSKFGFQAGGGCRIPFENRLSFTPDISYRLLGYKVVFNTPSFPPDLLAEDNNTTMHDIDLDLLLQFDVGKKANHFLIKAGPAFSLIVAGKERYNLQTGEHVERSMTFSVLNSYSRYNAAVVIQPGFITSSGFMICVNYIQYFFSMNNEDQGPSIRNHAFGLTVGKSFGKK